MRIALAGSLVVVMTQRLLPKVGGGRAAARGKVTLEDAKSGASNPHDFQLAMQQAGILAI